MTIRGWAEYLGFTLGPEAGHRGWSKTLDKVRERTEAWQSVGLGLHFASMAYNIYVSSLLVFLLQLDVIPPEWSHTEAGVLRKLIPGPAYWILPADLHRLGKDLGMPHNFNRMEDISLAARFRVAHREASSKGGLKADTQVRAVEEGLRNTPFLLRSGRWRAWYESSFCHNLVTAVSEGSWPPAWPGGEDMRAFSTSQIWPGAFPLAGCPVWLQSGPWPPFAHSSGFCVRRAL